MAIPSPDTLLPAVTQAKVTSNEFIAALTAMMGDAEATKLNYRGSGLYSFYVPNRMVQSEAEKVALELRTAGYQVHQITGQTGYLPPPWWHDISNAAHDTPDVKGYPQYEWTHVQVSKAKVAE